MSRARPNSSALIQRRFFCGTFPFAKLQKSHLALQAFVTATLHSAGPPRGMVRRMSEVFDARFVIVIRYSEIRPSWTASAGASPIPVTSRLVPLVHASSFGCVACIAVKLEIAVACFGVIRRSKVRVIPAPDGAGFASKPECELQKRRLPH